MLERSVVEEHWREVLWKCCREEFLREVLEKSVAEECLEKSVDNSCREVLEQSVVERSVEAACRRGSIGEECCREALRCGRKVLERSAVEKCWRTVL